MSRKLTFVAGAAGAAIVGAQIALLSSGPFNRSLPSHLLQLAAVLLATLSAVGCALRSREFSRQFWALIAIGFGVLAVAQSLRIYEHFWAPPPPHLEALGIRDFPFVFYMVPFLLALFLHENRHKGIELADWLDVLQVVAICFMLFNSLLYSRSLVADYGAAHVIQLFSLLVAIRNLGFTAAFWLRTAVSNGNERSALRTMAIYLSVYTAGSILGQWVYNTVLPHPNWIELEGSVPFAIAAVLFARWQQQPATALEQPSEFHRLLTLHLLPSLLPVLVLLTGIGLWWSHPKSTSVVIGVSSLLFGLRLLLTSYAEHHEAEARAKAESHFNVLAENNRDIILFMRYSNGQILEANEAATKAYGYTREELQSLTIKDLRATDTREFVPGQMGIANGEGILFETVHLRKDGSTFPVEVSSHGAAIGGTRTLISVIRDISERRLAEEELRQSEHRFRTLAAATFEGIVISERGRIVDTNEQLTSILGYERQEIVGREISSLLPPEDQERVLVSIREGTESHIEHRLLRKDGSTILVETHGQTVTYQKRPVRFTAIRDITERKRTEDALRLSEERFAKAFANNPAAIGITRLKDGVFLEVNDTWVELVGYSRKEMIGHSAREMNVWPTP